MTIKAIETVHNGYKFRSRLEARWAVFFDTLGIEYQYEPEGFDLGDGLWYLPDFWLPKQGSWIEIKPNHLIAYSWLCFEPNSIDTAVKCSKLAQSKGPVYLLTGEVNKPTNNDDFGMMVPYLVFFGYDNELEEISADHSQWWCMCSACGAIDLCYQAQADRIYCGCKARSHPKSNEMFNKATTAARQARFERNGR